MQSNPSAMPVAIYSVLCLLHMIEQLINSLTDPLKGWFPGTRFILSPFTAVICVSDCLRVCVSCLSQSVVAVPLSVSCLSHHVISLSHHPHQLSVLLPTQLSIPVSCLCYHRCQLSHCFSYHPCQLSHCQSQLSNLCSALAVYTTVNISYLTCLSHYFSCRSHCLNCHLSVMLSIHLSKMPTVNQIVWGKNISIPLSKCQLSI